MFTVKHAAELCCLALIAAPLTAQTPADEAQAHLTKARSLAGTQFLTAEELQCSELGGDNPYRIGTKEEHTAPTQVFDNLYYVGTKSVGSWAIKTSQGIILVDAMRTKSVESTLLPGLRKVGLDPAQVKYVIVTQADADAYGGAKYFQDKYSAQVIMSSADWDQLARIVATRSGRSSQGGDTLGGRRGGGGGAGGGGGGGGGYGGGGMGRGGGRGGFGGGRGGGGGGGGMGRGGNRGGNAASSSAADDKPARDQVAVDGQTFTLGDETVTVVLAPMHTPGSLSVIIPVLDHGTPHVAVVLGGTEIPGPSDMKKVYIASVQHLDSIATAAHVDAELNSYPFVDNAVARMDTLRTNHGAGTNPFVIGADAFSRYLGMMRECGWVALLRPAREPE